jgi:benzoate-CoA ligase
VPDDRSARRDAAVHDSIAAELQAYVRERLEPYKYPREILFLDTFPRTHLGKVDRAALRGLD